jgi:hypothetical protein
MYSSHDKECSKWMNVVSKKSTLVCVFATSHLFRQERCFDFWLVYQHNSSLFVEDVPLSTMYKYVIILYMTSGFFQGDIVSMKPLNSYDLWITTIHFHWCNFTRLIIVEGEGEALVGAVAWYINIKQRHYSRHAFQQRRLRPEAPTLKQVKGKAIFAVTVRYRYLERNSWKNAYNQ